MGKHLNVEISQFQVPKNNWDVNYKVGNTTHKSANQIFKKLL